jgi:YfiH family protein
MSRDRPTVGFSLTSLPNGWQVGRFDALAELAGTIHAFTTRRGPEFTDTPTAGPDVHRRLAVQLGLEDIAFCRQVHGVEIVNAPTHGPMQEGDGLITNRPGLGVMAFSADCPLILAADRAGKAVAVAHASWRGTVKRIGTRLVEALTAEFGVDPANLVACIGPSAGPCCYEVGASVERAAVRGIGLHAQGFFHDRGGKRHFDLWAANRDELIHAGVAAENTHFAGVCTICHNDLFPSYRAEGQGAGRFVGIIGLAAEA